MIKYISSLNTENLDNYIHYSENLEVIENHFGFLKDSNRKIGSGVSHDIPSWDIGLKGIDDNPLDIILLGNYWIPIIDYKLIRNAFDSGNIYNLSVELINGRRSSLGKYAKNNGFCSTSKAVGYIIRIESFQ